MTDDNKNEEDFSASDVETVDSADEVPVTIYPHLHRKSNLHSRMGCFYWTIFNHSVCLRVGVGLSPHVIAEG